MKNQDFHNKNIDIVRRNDTIMARYFMGMHIDLRMRRVLQPTILFAEFNIITKNLQIHQTVRYIHDNKSWERCYVLIETSPPCMRVIRFTYIKHTGMDKV